MWSSSNAEEMKSVWADALGGFSADSIASALRSCLEEPHCPNLPNFIAMCRRHAISHAKPVNVDSPLPNDQAVKVIAEAQKRAGLKASDKYDYKGWAKSIIADWENGTYTYRHGYEMAKKALNMEGV